MAIQAYQLTIGALQFGTWMQNDLHYLIDNTSGVTPYNEASNLLVDWYASCQSYWLACCPAQYSIQWIGAIRTSSGGGRSAYMEFPGNTEPGTLGSESSSLSTAPVIKLFPGMGVATQGRIYMPAPDEAYLVDNVYQSGYISAVGALISHFVSFTHSSRTWSLAIRSPKLNGTYAVSAATLGPIIGNIGRRRIPR